MDDHGLKDSGPGAAVRFEEPWYCPFVYEGDDSGDAAVA
jgi:hypothetical protein